jgi:N-acetylglucosaminyl-diphospho-decaprenol L-rhamnosyltransferase
MSDGSRSAAARTPDVSICIANHRTPELTLACLDSITRYSEGLAVEVLLVNNTADDRERMAAAVGALPRAQFIQNERPLSFAANQNLLMRRAHGRYLMALNSDTLLTPGALAELLGFADARLQCGMIGPKLVHPDGSLQPSCRNFPAPWTHFLEAAGLWQLLRNRRAVGRHYYICSPHDEAMAVDWLTGACLLVRAEVFARTGGYDELRFGGMYGEDIDWCRRIHAGGWQIWFDPAAVIVHAESASPLDGRTAQMYRGFYRYCALHLTRSRQRAMRAATWLALGPRWLLARDPHKRSVYRQIMQLPVE